MYPNENRYPDNLPNMEDINPPPMYVNQIRNPSNDMMNSNRPPYY